MDASRACPEPFRPAALLLAALMAGCAPQACLLPAQQSMMEIDLYFGRAIAGHAPVSEAEWARFAGQEVAANFPDGFTVIDANGQWLNAATHHAAREATKLVQIVTPGSPDLGRRVQAVIDAYKARFKQDSVGVVSMPRCAAF